jgi:hypothetical protein
MIASFQPDFKYERPRILVPWGSTKAWNAANESIRYHVYLHQTHFDRTEELALIMVQQLKSIFPLLDELARSACCRCPEPCCSTAKVWFDFHDLLFLHFSGQPLPLTQAMDNRAGHCRYLGENGCVLPRLLRPWICTRYLCPVQRSILKEKPVAVQTLFYHVVQAVKTGRQRMEDEFVRVVTRGAPRPQKVQSFIC